MGDGGRRDGSGVRVDNKPFQCYKWSSLGEWKEWEENNIVSGVGMEDTEEGQQSQHSSIQYLCWEASHRG